MANHEYQESVDDDGAGGGVIQKTLTGLLREDGVKSELAQKLEAQGKKAIYVERDANAPYKKTSQNWDTRSSPQQVALADPNYGDVVNDDEDGGGGGGLPKRLPTEVQDFQRVESTSPAQSPQQQPNYPSYPTPQTMPESHPPAPSPPGVEQQQQQQQQEQQPGGAVQQQVVDQAGEKRLDGTDNTGFIPPPMMSNVEVDANTEEWAFESDTVVFVADKHGNEYGRITMYDLKNRIASGEIDETIIKISLNNGNNYVEYNVAKNRLDGNDLDEYEYVVDPSYDVNKDPIAIEAKQQGKPLPKPPKKRVRKKKNNQENVVQPGQQNETKKKEEVVPGFEPGEPDDVKPPSSGCCVVL